MVKLKGSENTASDCRQSLQDVSLSRNVKDKEMKKPAFAAYLNIRKKAGF